MTQLFLLAGGIRRDPAVEAWFADHDRDVLRRIARTWFDRIRACGKDVVELMHDGCPTACVGEAAFAYVNAFRTHVNVGFFYGAMLKDPAGLLEGAGKRMRHVKLRPEQDVNADALARLVTAAYGDIRRRLGSR